MASIGVGAVVGYAIGTVQVLFVDWWRRVAAHRRQLLLLQSDLRRLRGFDTYFGWVTGVVPETERVPIAPKESELFVRTVGECEWRMTGEHEDDNAQQAYLNLLDGFALLRMSHEHAIELIDRLEASIPGQKEQFAVRAVGYSAQYDDVLDQVLFQIDGLLADLDRRLPLATVGEQSHRVFGMLPPSPKALPFIKESPEFAKWKRVHGRAS